MNLIDRYNNKITTKIFYLNINLERFVGNLNSYTTNQLEKLTPKIIKMANQAEEIKFNLAEYIGARGEPSELKYLSSSRNRHQPRFRK